MRIPAKFLLEDFFLYKYVAGNCFSTGTNRRH